MMAFIVFLIGAIFSVVGLIITLPFLALWFWILVRILHKAGFSGWWSLTTFFPPLLVVMLWVLAFADWPLAAPRIEIIPPPRRW
jgi:uncharacterized membrane protein YhaH (DUF805 family)